MTFIVKIARQKCNSCELLHNCPITAVRRRTFLQVHKRLKATTNCQRPSSTFSRSNCLNFTFFNLLKIIELSNVDIIVHLQMFEGHYIVEIQTNSICPWPWFSWSNVSNFTDLLLLETIKSIKINYGTHEHVDRRTCLVYASCSWPSV